MPHNFPLWTAVYHQAQLWMFSGVFAVISHELRVIVRIIEDRESRPTGIILEARTMQSTPESGSCGGFDGHKKKKGLKIHAAVDTLGNLLALTVTPANENEGSQVQELATRVQEITGQSVEIALADQGYRGEESANAAAEQNIQLIVVKHKEAKRVFVLLPRRWVVERTFRWLGRFRRLARDYERWGTTLKGWHWLAS